MTRIRHIQLAALCASLLLAGGAARAADAPKVPDYGPNLERFEYPHEVHRHTVNSQGQALSMAYMDVKPKQANGRTVVLHEVAAAVRHASGYAPHPAETRAASDGAICGAVVPRRLRAARLEPANAVGNYWRRCSTTTGILRVVFLAYPS